VVMALATIVIGLLGGETTGWAHPAAPMKMNHYFGFRIPPASRTKKRSTELVVTNQIGHHLRCLYEDILRQPVPGRFLELLRQLEGTSSALPAHVESHDREA